MSTTRGDKSGARRRMPRFGASKAAPKSASERVTKKTQQSLTTRRKILDAAEKLFAEHGFYGVTIREVAHAARIDTSLLHYHFGNKEQLFDQVVARRAEIANRVRMDALDAYEAQTGGKITAQGALEAFLMPLMKLLAEGGAGWKRYFALIAQLSSTPGWGGAVMARHFDPVVRRLMDMLRRAYPDTPEAEFYWSYQFLLGSLMLTLADTGRIEPLSGNTLKTSDVASLAPRLLQFSSAGVERLCGPKK